MKLWILAATAVLSGALITVAPSFGQAQPAGQAAVVRQDVQALRGAVEALRTACQQGDVPGARAALQEIVADWKALPPAVKQRIEANHPELVERVAAWKEVPQEIQALKGDIQQARAAHEQGNAAGVRAALEQVVADFKELPPAVKVLIENSHPELVQRVQALRNK